jgi:hypothetical protein
MMEKDLKSKNGKRIEASSRRCERRQSSRQGSRRRMKKNPTEGEKTLRENARRWW